MEYRFCKECGALIDPPTARFCTSCGAEQSGVTVSITEEVEAVKPAEKKESSPAKKFFMALLQCLGYLGVYQGAQITVSFAFILMAIITAYGAGDFQSAYLESFSKVTPLVSFIAIPIVLTGYVLFYKKRKKNFLREMKVSRVNPAPVIALLLVGVLYNFAVVGALRGLYSLIPALQSVSVSDKFEKIYQYTNPVLEFVETAILIPVFEEILFRGIIYNKLRGVLPKTAAILLGGLFFAGAHGNIEQFCYVLPMGILMCAVYDKYGSVFVTLAIHIGFNGANELMNLFMSGMSVGLSVALGIIALALMAVIIACLFLIKKEENEENETV